MDLKALSNSELLDELKQILASKSPKHSLATKIVEELAGRAKEQSVPHSTPKIVTDDVNPK